METKATYSTMVTTIAAAASLNVRTALMSSDAEIIGNSSTAAQASTSQIRPECFGASRKPAAATENQIRFNSNSILCSVYVQESTTLRSNVEIESEFPRMRPQ